MQNVKSFLSQKSRFDLVERIKNENKNRTRASLFQSSVDGKQKIFMWPQMDSRSLRTHFSESPFRDNPQISAHDEYNRFKIWKQL